MTDTAQEQEGVEDAIRHLKGVSSTLDDETFKAINAVVRETRRLRARQREEGDECDCGHRRIAHGAFGGMCASLDCDCPAFRTDATSHPEREPVAWWECPNPECETGYDPREFALRDGDKSSLCQACCEEHLILRLGHADTEPPAEPDRA